MKSILNLKIIFFPLLFIFCTSLYSQSKEQKIKTIRQEFQKINQDRSLKSITLDDPEEFLGHATDGGGELTGYFKKDSIRKIVLTVGLSYGEIKDEYFFKNDQLVFVYETEKDFAHDSSGTLLDKLNVVFEGRYYFDNNKLLDKIEKGKRLFEKENMPSVLLEDAKDYMKLIKVKRK